MEDINNKQIVTTNFSSQNDKRVILDRNIATNTVDHGNTQTTTTTTTTLYKKHFDDLNATELEALQKYEEEQKNKSINISITSAIIGILAIVAAIIVASVGLMAPLIAVAIVVPIGIVATSLIITNIDDANKRKKRIEMTKAKLKEIYSSYNQPKKLIHATKDIQNPNKENNVKQENNDKKLVQIKSITPTNQKIVHKIHNDKSASQNINKKLLQLDEIGLPSRHSFDGTQRIPVNELSIEDMQKIRDSALKEDFNGIPQMLDYFLREEYGRILDEARHYNKKLSEEKKRFLKNIEKYHDILLVNKRLLLIFNAEMENEKDENKKSLLKEEIQKCKKFYQTLKDVDLKQSSNNQNLNNTVSSPKLPATTGIMKISNISDENSNHYNHNAITNESKKQELTLNKT